MPCSIRRPAILPCRDLLLRSARVDGGSRNRRFPPACLFPRTIDLFVPVKVNPQPCQLITSLAIEKSESISSTFRDMHAERDHLVTAVSPELRERVENVGLEFYDVDLLRGVSPER